ncbi:MAG: hypothetical protein WEB06_16135 [Actinomycetota bacterium]
MSLLGDRLLAVHGALAAAELPHAFGGAIALGYCTTEPRGTRDLDVNIFIEPERANEVYAALPPEIRVTKGDREAIRRDGQARLRWGDTPVDVFFDTHEFHREVAGAILEVPFEGSTIPVLGCNALAVFKAMFNRTQDWADIEAMLRANTLDCEQVLARLRSFLGPSDVAVVRLAALCAP